MEAEYLPWQTLLTKCNPSISIHRLEFSLYTLSIHLFFLVQIPSLSCIHVITIYFPHLHCTNYACQEILDDDYDIPSIYVINR